MEWQDTWTEPESQETTLQQHKIWLQGAMNDTDSADVTENRSMRDTDNAMRLGLEPCTPKTKTAPPPTSTRSTSAIHRRCFRGNF